MLIKRKQKKSELLCSYLVENMETAVLLFNDRLKADSHQPGCRKPAAGQLTKIAWSKG